MTSSCGNCSLLQQQLAQHEESAQVYKARLAATHDVLAELGAKKQDVRNLLAQLSERTRQRDELQKELSEMYKRLASIYMEVNPLKDDLIRCQTENIRFLTELGLSRAKIEEQKQMIAARDIAVEQIKEKATKFEALSKEFEAKLKALTDQHKKLVTTADTSKSREKEFAKLRNDSRKKEASMLAFMEKLGAILEAHGLFPRNEHRVLVKYRNAFEHAPSSTINGVHESDEDDAGSIDDASELLEALVASSTNEGGEQSAASNELPPVSEEERRRVAHVPKVAAVEHTSGVVVPKVAVQQTSGGVTVEEKIERRKPPTLALSVNGEVKNTQRSQPVSNVKPTPAFVSHPVRPTVSEVAMRRMPEVQERKKSVDDIFCEEFMKPLPIISPIHSPVPKLDEEELPLPRAVARVAPSVGSGSALPLESSNESDGEIPKFTIEEDLAMSPSPMSPIAALPVPLEVDEPVIAVVELSRRAAEREVCEPSTSEPVTSRNKTVQKSLASRKTPVARRPPPDAAAVRFLTSHIETFIRSSSKTPNTFYKDIASPPIPLSLAAFVQAFRHVTLACASALVRAFYMQATRGVVTFPYLAVVEVRIVDLIFSLAEMREGCETLPLEVVEALVKAVRVEGFEAVQVQTMCRVVGEICRRSERDVFESCLEFARDILGVGNGQREVEVVDALVSVGCAWPRVLVRLVGGEGVEAGLFREMVARCPQRAEREKAWECIAKSVGEVGASVQPAQSRPIDWDASFNAYLDRLRTLPLDADSPELTEEALCLVDSIVLCSFYAPSLFRIVREQLVGSDLALFLAPGGFVAAEAIRTSLSVVLVGRLIVVVAKRECKATKERKKEVREMFKESAVLVREVMKSSKARRSRLLMGVLEECVRRVVPFLGGNRAGELRQLAGDG